MCSALAHVRFVPIADIDTYFVVIPERKRDRLVAVSSKSSKAICSGGSCLGAGLQKGQEIGINRVRVRGYHAVRQALVGF